jgi:hypothetical protein
MSQLIIPYIYYGFILLFVTAVGILWIQLKQERDMNELWNDYKYNSIGVEYDV